MLSCEYYEVSKNSFFHGTPPVAASDLQERFAVTSVYFNVSFEVACEVQCEDNYRYIHYLAVKRTKRQEKRRKREHYKEY